MAHAVEYFGFELISSSPTCVKGKFTVSEKSGQVHGFLNGGVTALIAESVGSLGAAVAAQTKYVVGCDLSISHLQPVPLGTEVQVIGTPHHVGKRLQVWEIKFLADTSSRKKPGMNEESTSKASEPSLIAISKLTATLLHSKPEDTFDVKELKSNL